jgi:hypothetical protein
MRCCSCSQVLAGRWTLQEIRGEVPTDRERIETNLAVTEAAEASKEQQ